MYKRFPFIFSIFDLCILFYFLTGIGMDASVTPLRHGGLSLVQTTDFFYPLVDDPYMMVCGGRGKQQFFFIKDIYLIQFML